MNVADAVRNDGLPDSASGFACACEGRNLHLVDFPCCSQYNGLSSQADTTAWNNPTKIFKKRLCQILSRGRDPHRIEGSIAEAPSSDRFRSPVLQRLR